MLCVRLAAAATRPIPVAQQGLYHAGMEWRLFWINAADGALMRQCILVAHSWGCMVAGHLAGRCPDLIDRLVMFGPIARRDPTGDAPRLPAWRLISLQDQWDRFTADVPAGEPPVLSRRHFAAWGEAYLDSEQRQPRPRSGCREDPQWRVSGHLRRLGGPSGLRSRPDPGARRHHTRHVGQDVHRCRRRLAVRRDARRSDPA